MKTALFAWIGRKDLECAVKDGKEGLGAIAQAVTAQKYDDVILLSDYPNEKTEPYLEWLQRMGHRNIQIKTVALDGDPTNYRVIYLNAKAQVQGHLDRYKKSVGLTFHLSPGTPQMATTWIILANSVFSANLIQSSPQKGVQKVDLPFEIAADFLPEILKKNEKKISSIFDSDSAPANFDGIIHKSKIMKDLVARAKMAAPYPVPVLIQGETGTGKELLAKAIHNTSLRKGRFIAINCGAIPEELFESELFGHKKGSFTGAISDKAGLVMEAHGGTLFLDEIGEMPTRIQVKLLRTLQEGTFNRVGDPTERKTDIRIISATNRDLQHEINLGTFREDLFHRLAVAVLYIPALRDRAEDLGLLIDHLLNDANEKLSRNIQFNPKDLTATAKAFMLKQHWPGNVRELQNTITRALLWTSGGRLEKEAIEGAIITTQGASSDYDTILDRRLDENFDLEKTIAEVARHYLEKAMLESGGNKTKARKMLNFKSYQRLDLWLKKYSIVTK